MVAFFTPLNLLILMVAQNCLTITECADSGRKRDKNVSTAPSKSSAKKSRNVREAASTSGAVAGAGSSRRRIHNWTAELDDDILATYYNNLGEGSSDWNTIFMSLSARHPNIPHSAAVNDRVHRLLGRIVQSTQGQGEGNVLWTSFMKADVLKIYYRTRGGDEMEHALNMYNKWRNEHPRYPDISPMDLLHQAENMLIRQNLLPLSTSLSQERLQKIFADKYFKFNSEQEVIFREACDKLPPNERMELDNFYDELCEKDPKFSAVSPLKLYYKAYNLMKPRKSRHRKSRAPDVTEEETHFLGQSGQEEHHQFHEFMGVEDNPLVHSKGSQYHTREIGSSSSHRGPPHDHPDLDLSLGSGTFDTPQSHQPDVDLDLNLSSWKKKGKSIWKRGSS